MWMREVCRLCSKVMCSLSHTYGRLGWEKECCKGVNVKVGGAKATVA